jgi:sRNA-binding regulator protein Hfq
MSKTIKDQEQKKSRATDICWLIFIIAGIATVASLGCFDCFYVSY